MVLKSRPVVTMAGISRYFGGQDGRVVKAGALGDAHVKVVGSNLVKSWLRKSP